MKDFLVVGCGSIGRRHIECLRDLGVPNIYVVEPIEGIRKMTCDLFEIKESFESIDEALKRDYDGALVAVPSNLHSEIACKIIEKKIDLIIEKPIETDMAAALKIKQAVEKNDVICLIAYAIRFDAGFQKIYEILQSEKLGKIYSVDIRVGNYLPNFRPGTDYRKAYSANKSMGGGVCLDLSHELDYFRWFFGEPKEIFPVVRKISDLEIDVEDLVEVLVVAESGVVGHIHLDYLSRVITRKISIVGSEGNLDFDAFAGRLEVYIGGEEYTQYKKFSAERNIVYQNQFRHFFECVRERKQPAVTADDGCKTLKFALDILKDFEV